jgi:hypothetical protein
MSTRKSNHTRSPSPSPKKKANNNNNSITTTTTNKKTNKTSTTAQDDLKMVMVAYIPLVIATIVRFLFPSIIPLLTAKSATTASV